MLDLRTELSGSRRCLLPLWQSGTKRLILFIAAGVVAQQGNTSWVRAESNDRPNVLLILADDLGYSDLGCYGGEIETPNLDALAGNGLRFTQFYNTARCWPTRAAVLTGYYAQQVRRDVLPGIKRGNRPSWAKLLGQFLKQEGYRCYHSGKWHLDGKPLQNGFDRSYYLRDQGRFFNPRVHFLDDVKLPPVEPNTGFYGTIAIADHVVECLKDHAAHHRHKPFFHYLAFTAPHFPLHALPEDIAGYRQRYRAGWDEIRKQRWQRMKKFGVASGALSSVEEDVGPPYHFPEHLKLLGDGELNRPLPWDELKEVQQQFQAEKMAVHAAMVHRMDLEIGRVLEQLRAMGAFDNTVILFLSDNGASAEIMVRDDGHDPKAAAGSAATYLCLGPGWSTVANTPFRRHKTWVHEGGIATPLIVHWPQGISARGELRHSSGHVIDLFPTIVELALGAAAESTGAEGSTPVPPRPGRSLVSVFADGGDLAREDLWWCHEGNRALRVGNWKLVAAEGDPWELYDLAADRNETNNLADRFPERVKELEQRWMKHASEFVGLSKQDVAR